MIGSVLLLVATTLAGGTGDWAWTDGRDLPLDGKGFAETDGYWARLPADAKGKVSDETWTISHQCSGLSYTFTTDSDKLRIEWSLLENRLGGPTMPASASEGIDVYGLFERNPVGVPCEPPIWRWVKTGVPKAKNGNVLELSVEPGRTYRVYLPLLNGLTSIRFGVKPGAAIRPVKGRDVKPIVVYGASTGQGCCVTRPGMSWVNQFARLLDAPVFGFTCSGQGKMSDADLEILKRIDAGGYVLQTLSNMPVEGREERYESFLRSLAAAKPYVPIVMCSCHHPGHDGRRIDAFFGNLIERFRAEDWDAWGGYLFYVPSDMLCPKDGESTVDGGHPNDYGATVMAKAIASVGEVAFRSFVHRTIPDLERPLAKELDAWQRDFRYEPTAPQLDETPPKGFHGRIAALEWIDKSNAVGPEGDRTWRVKAWRNERVHGQFVVWTDEPLKEVALRTGDLVSASGAKIPASRLTARFVRYVYSWCRRVPTPKYRGDILDDAKRVDMAERGYRPAWLTVDVPADAEPGVYRGTFAFRACGGETVEFPVELEVIGRTLPAKNDFFLDFWQQPWRIAQFHRVKPLSPEHYALMEPHFRELGAAGQKVITTWVEDSVWGRGQGTPRTLVRYLWHKDGSRTFDFTDFDRHVEFAKRCGIGPQIHCYALVNWAPEYHYIEAETGDDKVVEAKPGEAAWKDYWGPLLKAIEAHAREKGWLGDVYMALDEVGRDGETKAAAFLRETAPGLKLTMSGCELPERYGFTIDTYSEPLQGESFLKPEMDEDIAARRKAGRITTFYICCWPLKPNAGFGSDLCEQQWLGLYAAYKRYDGLLRWAMHLWPRDPYFGELLYSPEWELAGDYYLAYPGGNVSVRWEMIRDSIEDYRKIAALRESGEATPELEAALKDLDFPLVRHADEPTIRAKVERVQKILLSVPAVAPTTSSHRPICKIGFLTDTHLRPGADEINDRTRKAFEVFRAQGVDAIGHCGDLADLHYPEMYDLYRSFIEQTYPDEAKRPQLLYVYANHDLIDVAKWKAGVAGAARQMPFEEGFRDMKNRLGIGHWLFHSTEVKGVPVVVLPQIFEYEGGIARVERMLEEACAAHPTGPIVVMAHLPPAGTVYGSDRWGYWNYRQVLEKFPRVISFSGHTHNSLRNPASFWQGAFSAVDVGCLEWWYGREEDGCDGGFACRVKSAYGVPVAEFFPDRVVIRRYDVRDGSEIGADDPWMVRQPYEGQPSSARGGRVPRFADGAKLSVEERGDKVVLTFPTAEREDDVFRYRIEASVREGNGWHALVKGGCYSQFYLRPSERKDVCVREIARNAFQNELTYRFTVTPVGVDGTEGPALQADMTTH